MITNPFLFQAMLEEKLGKLYVNLSLHQTLHQLLQDRELKLADKLKSEFKLSERKYFWLKVYTCKYLKYLLLMVYTCLINEIPLSQGAGFWSLPAVARVGSPG